MNQGNKNIDDAATSFEKVSIRQATPEDYPRVIEVVDNWWGGRHMADMLPKLFFVHFRPTCFVAESRRMLQGFLVGFVSQTFPDEAYIHFVGVHPDYRDQDLGRTLYDHFFASVVKSGVGRVQCVTSPVNKGSIAFHLRMGFQMVPGDKVIDGIRIFSNYDGMGEDRVLFFRILGVDEK
ncbi:MAG: GNAT family N-acetyltransferase [Deltaproteobacteria bacterium]|nr:GNAT family N-acetyltransferase [Deltaproteobacteria bacterium]